MAELGVLLQDPGLADRLDRASVLAALDELERLISANFSLKNRLTARLISLGSAKDSRTSAGDSLLTVTEAAGLLGVTADWLYRRASRLPFTRRIGRRHLRFSRRDLHAYIDRQKVGREAS